VLHSDITTFLSARVTAKRDLNQTTMVRRLRLAPGVAMPWHRDPFQRVAIVMRGDLLSIEYRDGGESERVAIAPGQADWESLVTAFIGR
jgi:quercetin dioxygenase-like cupin family protein